MRLNDAAGGVLVDLGLADRLALALGDLGVWAIGVARVAGVAHLLPVVWGNLGARSGGVDLSYEAEAVDAHGVEQAAGDCAGCDAGGGLAGAGALERFAAVGGEPLDAAGEVRVARARSRDGGRALGGSEA